MFCNHHHERTAQDRATCASAQPRVGAVEYARRVGDSLLMVDYTVTSLKFTAHKADTHAHAIAKEKSRVLTSFLASMASDDGERRASEFTALSAIFEGCLGDDANGPWQVPLDVGGAVLEVHLPKDYPSVASPTPFLFAPTLSEDQISDLGQELLSMYEEDCECVFSWVAHCKDHIEAIENHLEAVKAQEQKLSASASAAALAADALAADAEGLAAGEDGDGAAFTYVPPTSKYGQRVRHFGVVDDSFKVAVVSDEPFHPPKSGPGETFQAHVAPVTSMGNVNWVLAALLRDKKIARATHNMIAYSFVDERGVHVFDNDDDGEGGSGAKLAATIENTGAQNVLVVVSRWFGGVHLGPARFKYIASVAGALLDKEGYCRRQHGKKK
jgi:hypothetical protein